MYIKYLMDQCKCSINNYKKHKQLHYYHNIQFCRDNFWKLLSLNHLENWSLLKDRSNNSLDQYLSSLHKSNDRQYKSKLLYQNNLPCKDSYDLQMLIKINYFFFNIKLINFIIIFIFLFFLLNFTNFLLIDFLKFCKFKNYSKNKIILFQK